MMTDSDMPAAVDEREAVLRFLRREQAKFERHASNAALPGESQKRCAVRASILQTVHDQIQRGDHHLPE